MRLPVIEEVPNEASEGPIAASSIARESRSHMEEVPEDPIFEEELPSSVSETNLALQIVGLLRSWREEHVGRVLELAQWNF